MPDLAHWALFMSATLVLLITPGPSIMYVVSRAVVLGWRAAVLSSVGLALGDLLQVIATALGLAAVLVSAPRLFLVLKLVGALYLMSLGAATLMGKGARVNYTEPQSRRALSPKSLIFQGFLALNPKTLLFFAAFLPQFVTPKAGSLRTQIILFGIAFVVLGFVTNSAFGCVGGRLAESAGKKFQLMTRFVGGFVLIALGMLAVLTPIPRRPN
jgi:threonine/homoserine/homoserine lactone efflux protein